MPSIDERIVSIAFENQVFEARVATTMATLSKLDTSIKNIGSATGLQNIEAAANKVTLQGPMSALDKLKAKLGGAGAGASEGLGEIDRAGNKVTLEGPARAVDKLQGKMAQLSAGTTFTDIDRAADRVTLSGLTNALDNVTAKFSVLQGAASVALGGIASTAAMKGGAFAKSFAFGPIQDGLAEYSTNLNSIQTILANTQGQQVSGLGAVQDHLAELNTYSDKTIYNFSEMAKNIGTFTAAGVGLDESTKSIKGIANLAALSGSNSQQASTAMYQLSQAIASGRVGLQDWNSVVNAGMGGAVFQKALMRTADSMGALEKGAVKLTRPPVRPRSTDNPSVSRLWPSRERSPG
jgi:tape measure domain-containing protein